MRDLKEDLEEFLGEATGVISPEAADREKGWLGVMLEPINKEYAKARSLPSGALWVTHAVQGGPAKAAGLRTGDLLVELNGEPIKFSGRRALDYFLQSLRPSIGDPFRLTALRDGERIECSGEFAKQPEPVTLHAEDIGVSVTELTDGDIFAHNLFVEEGIWVTDVHRGGSAATSSRFGKSLLAEGDVIMEVAGQPVPSIRAFADVLETLRRERPEAVLVRYKRGRVNGYAGINLTIGDKDNGGKP
jgi:serine protease Do